MSNCSLDIIPENNNFFFTRAGILHKKLGNLLISAPFLILLKLKEFLQGESEHIDFEKKLQKYMEDLLIYGEAKIEL